MDTTKTERRKLVTIPHDEFEAMLELAAERGAKRALADVGLEGLDAAQDIRELRSLLDALKEAKKTAGLTVIKLLITGLVVLTVTGAILKFKTFGSH